MGGGKRPQGLKAPGSSVRPEDPESVCVILMTNSQVRLIDRQLNRTPYRQVNATVCASSSAKRVLSPDFLIEDPIGGGFAMDPG